MEKINFGLRYFEVNHDLYDMKSTTYSNFNCSTLDKNLISKMIKEFEISNILGNIRGEINILTYRKVKFKTIK